MWENGVPKHDGGIWRVNISSLVSRPHLESAYYATIPIATYLAAKRVPGKASSITFATHRIERLRSIPDFQTLLAWPEDTPQSTPSRCRGQTSLPHSLSLISSIHRTASFAKPTPHRSHPHLQRYLLDISTTLL